MSRFKFLLVATCCCSILFGTQAQAQYTLTVEASTPVAALGTTYRFYVDMNDPTDRMSAIFGNDQAPLEINAPSGAFNSSFNASWSASGINPAFLGFFPDMADDTYATIGLDGPASASTIVGAADPSIVEDSAQPITPFFGTDGATTLLANTLTGASYYVLNTAGNGLPDANLRVLVLQITSTGCVNGILNYQVFPLGVGADQVQISMPFDCTGTFGGSTGVAGCMDVTACNYDATATTDDGSCLIPTGCDYCSNGTVANGDSDGDGICDNAEIPGCQDPTACNYDPIYTDDAGNCFWAADNGWCDCNGDILDALGVCGGTCASDADGNGVCDDAEILGCMDATACNYDATATQDDGSCAVNDECGVCGGTGIPASDCDCNGNQLDALGVCGGLCTSDADGNGVCDDAEILGCMDATACNYDAATTQDDGSCDYCSCAREAVA
ncbi:MAG TPA: hypothetical protein EYO58_12525, partial [Flavobacteriales bacterium]|nr:hypothetical protein [Flavobacteriales bacterium]